MIWQADRRTSTNSWLQQLLNYAGYCDASAFGAGGVWFIANLTNKYLASPVAQ
jgi:hypothetical protein